MDMNNKVQSAYCQYSDLLELTDISSLLDAIICDLGSDKLLVEVLCLLPSKSFLILFQEVNRVGDVF
jgi:hypothetical protein